MLYSFLNSDDLDSAIKEEMLHQLVRDNLGMVAVAEASAVSLMKDYLGQRFSTDDIFPVIGEWSAGNDYGPAKAILLGGEPDYDSANNYGLAFYERPSGPPAGTPYTPPYAINDAGRITNYAWHQGECYQAISNGLGVEPGVEEPTTWKGYWRLRDPRDQKVVSFCVDITLFNLFRRVAPRKIPDLRISLYNQAKEWLTLVRDGSLTPDLPRPPKVQDNSDAIRWGSNAPQQHYY